MSMRPAFLALGLGLLLIGCGESESQGAPTASPAVTTKTAATTADEQPVESGVTPSVSTENSPRPTSTQDDEATTDEIPQVAIQGQVRDDPAPYFGSQSASGGVAEPAPGFTPAAVDSEFCAAVSVINSSPQPTDDFEEVVVAAQYFEAIEQHVPAELAAPFALVLEFARNIVDAGSFEDADEPTNGDAMSEAIASLNNFVDTQCLGVP